MKLGLAWFMPVIVLKSNDGLGHSLWNVIWTPDGTKNGNAILYRHELWHVKQDIVTFFLGPLLRNFRSINLRMEAAAYGESIRAFIELRNPSEDQVLNEIHRYALILAGAHYDLNVTSERASELILEYTKSRRLI